MHSETRKLLINFILPSLWENTSTPKCQCFRQSWTKYLELGEKPIFLSIFLPILPWIQYCFAFHTRGDSQNYNIEFRGRGIQNLRFLSQFQYILSRIVWKIILIYSSYNLFSRIPVIILISHCYDNVVRDNIWMKYLSRWYVGEEKTWYMRVELLHMV